MERILVVDDDPDCQTLVGTYLEHLGYQVELASSGVEALERFEKNPHDLVISDAIMPEMDGFEFCRRLRATRAGQLVPFIFLSGQADLKARVEGHEIGGDDYLVKPFQRQEIAAKVKAALERSRRVYTEIIRLLQHTGSDSLKVPNATVSINEPEPLPLTPAEKKVFWGVVSGYTNKQISERLFISPRTVQAHLSKIFNKLQLKNRSQLVRFALERGYKPPASL
ncbi:MAG: response regulator transcription factor [Oscillatoriaceae bacterium SKW80]|nr:response regulator transcription factor [Oscillatoriaceae bacterium SKYG93]MCX8122148.1 response regulator transcription factor [Oscillatoriaceae bacterium SKW80]MDW8454435.1 response regulator transcription factor [Oscillatoriaceae cyanobacterium SKYGB_i_bin93]HIK29299.1 response regulator transcription factor [Oscillatoriaceae cyanobacterium M7585_C2015_266]